ncbi:MAG: 3-dehydroquinate synthase [Bacillota bacterium]|nr:3-dehydroquinate synthase [Bacillota bacterium]
MRALSNILVDIPEKAYWINIQNQGLQTAGALIREVINTNKIFLISNPTVYGLYGEVVARSLEEAGFEVLTGLMPDGEIYKNMDEVLKLIDQGLHWELERGHAVVALGGGVVGDLVGFVAAIYQRGIDFFQIPTTLLSMVDSSIGGKVAVNHPGGKNLIGAFHQPKGVLIDPHALNTLPEEEYLCGLGEVVKYGIIYDEEFFVYMEKNAALISKRDSEVLEKLIERSCINKSRIVASDEKEQGLRIILNLGHTFGHAIEKMGDFQRFKHGQSVAMGIIMASFLAWEMGLLSTDEKKRIEQLLTNLHLPCNVSDLNSEQIFLAMQHDKKAKNGKLRFVLPNGIGSYKVTDDVTEPMIRRAIDYGIGYHMIE